jgi:hypothetical protein
MVLQLLLLLLLLLQGKPAASKGMDRLSGRSRVRTPDDSPMDYLPQVRGLTFDFRPLNCEF